MAQNLIEILEKRKQTNRKRFNLASQINYILMRLSFSLNRQLGHEIEPEPVEKESERLWLK